MKSLLILLFSPALAILQFIPYTSVLFLMFGPTYFVHAFIFNVAMLAVVIEAFIKKEHAWLLVPVVWFGGYEALAVMNWKALEPFRAQIASQNIGAAVQFDSKRDALVIEQSEPIAGLPDRLLRDYSLNEVVISRPAGRHFVRTRRYLANTATCRRLGDFPWDEGRASAEQVTDDKTMTPIAGVCWINRSQRLDRAEVKLAATVEEGRFQGVLPYRTEVVSLTRAGRMVAQTAGAKVKRYAWFPLPYFGCFPTNSRWACDGGLWGETVAIQDKPIERAIAALGLNRSTLAERVGEVAAEQASEFDVSGPEASRLQKELSDFLQDDSAQIAQSYVNRLVLRSDLYKSRLPELAAALCRSAELNHPERAAALAELLVKLPAFRSFDPIEPSTQRAIVSHVRRARGIVKRDGDIDDPMSPYWQLVRLDGQYDAECRRLPECRRAVGDLPNTPPRC